MAKPRPQKQRRYTISWRALLPLGLLALALSLRLAEPSLLTDIRLAVFDQYQTLKPREKTPVPVQLVDIDEQSLERLGQWPWPRSQLARLVDAINDAGAAAIVIDVLLSEPDRLSPSAVAEMIPDWPEYQSAREAILGRKGHDEQFAQSLARANSVLCFALHDEVVGEMPKPKAGLVQAGDPPDPFLLSFAGGISALPILTQAVEGYGACSLIPDPDGVVRRAPMLVSVAGIVLPMLDAEALRVAQAASTYIVKSTNASGEQSFGVHGGVVGVKIGGLSVPTDHQGRIWIRYSDQTAKSIGASDLLAGKFDPEAIAGKIVLLGSSAAGLSRPQPVPVLGVVPALQIRAQILETLISGDFLHQPDWAKGAEVLALLLFGLLLIWLLPRWGAMWCAIIGLGAIAGAVGASWTLFSQYNTLTTPFYFAVVIVLLYLTQSLQVYLASEKEKKEVRGAFGRYLSPVLVEQLANDPDKLKLGGETRQISALFCDIRGFTSLSERFAPEELTDLLNRFLTPLTEVILNEQGTIDKYMGDCIMAFWNAPVDVVDHEHRACSAALKMLDALAELNETLQREAAASGTSMQELRIGIGINSGSALAGNLGSEQRFDYSVLGDSVNLASRLEGQSKAYGVEILLSEATRTAVKDLAFLELDLVQVVGKSEPVRIFSLLGDALFARTNVFIEAETLQTRMLGYYRTRRWQEALEVIGKLEQLELDSFKGYLLMMRKRIEAFKASPPGADWDGVERRLVK